MARRPAPEVSTRLTARETEVLRLLARGLTYAQTAAQLGMSAHTVASHVKKLYRKLGAHSAVEAVMRGVQLKLID